MARKSCIALLRSAVLAAEGGSGVGRARLGEGTRPMARKSCIALLEFIVIGGAAATLHGSDTTTEDLDIPASTPENIERLLLLLADLDAEFRYDFAHRRLRPRNG